MQKVAQAYLSTHIATTDQGQLLLMLYDGALKFLAQAREKILARDMAGKGMLISRAIDIVNELASSLNMEKGGNLADNLNNLYFLCTARLLQANATLDLEQLDSVVKILTGLRSAYAQIIHTPEAQAAAAQISARQSPQEADMAKRNAPVVAATTPVAPSAMGRLQAQAAYQTMTMGAAPAPQSPVESAATPLAVPAASGGFNKGMAAYGKLAAGG
jgi:flagellar protein FliS